MSPLIGRQANGRVRGWFRRSPGRHGSSAQCQDRDRCVLADAGPDAVTFYYTPVQGNVTESLGLGKARATADRESGPGRSGRGWTDYLNTTGFKSDPRLIQI